MEVVHFAEFTGIVHHIHHDKTIKAIVTGFETLKEAELVVSNINNSTRPLK